jgi:hypothetical protein
VAVTAIDRARNRRRDSRMDMSGLLERKTEAGHRWIRASRIPRELLKNRRETCDPRLLPPLLARKLAQHRAKSHTPRVRGPGHTESIPEPFACGHPAMVAALRQIRGRPLSARALAHSPDAIAATEAAGVSSVG